MTTARDLTWTDLDQRAVNTARVLAADAVEKCGSGHPGTAISLAPVAYLLFNKVLRHDPKDPNWIGRDRFVLSCGHTSLTLYTQLYLSGYGLDVSDFEALRTWDSQTPGHPEVGHTPGVEMTTGPLGQGLASAVGMAMNARRMRGLLDADTLDGQSPFDHHIFVLASDGDLQEGVTSEASSLAGHQELGNLIVIWDDNRISIEDDTEVAISEDVLGRYDAYGWHTQRVDWTDGGEYTEDVDALHAAIEAAKADTGRPSIIALRTIIGWPSPGKQNTGGIHGAKLGDSELTALKDVLDWPQGMFRVDEEAVSHARAVQDRADKAHKDWDSALSAWKTANPEAAKLADRLFAGELPEAWGDALPDFAGETTMATRKASGAVLNSLSTVMPELWGGSADLAGSNNTSMKGEASFLPEKKSTSTNIGHKYGRTLHFGIREHAMGSIVNGMHLHGGTRAYCGTFLVFADYMRPAVRLAALMKTPSIFVWTHDSIGLGEDGPTHQPIEHLASLRAIPGLDVVRPADAHETREAWRAILSNQNNPAGLCLTRQNLPVLDSELADKTSQVSRGAYVLSDSDDTPDVLLLATGSEVHLALEAAETLRGEGKNVRVVSMPCFEWFSQQDEAYRESVLPKAVRARVSVEAALAMPWHQFLGDCGEAISLENYGASAPYQELYERFGITASAIVDAAHRSMTKAAH